jgi:hypothetical protein
MGRALITSIGASNPSLNHAGPPAQGP